MECEYLVKVNKNDVFIKLEVFFQRLLKDISNIQENELRQIPVISTRK